MQELELDGRVIRLPDADGDFPPVTSIVDEQGAVRLVLEVSDELDWFRGHFPGQPVLPGVVQLHWAVLVAQALFGFTGIPREIKRLKFKKVVTPPATLELELSRQGSDEVQFGFSGNDDAHSEGRLVFPGGPT